jgi:hypothetical protein
MGGDAAERSTDEKGWRPVDGRGCGGALGATPAELALSRVWPAGTIRTRTIARRRSVRGLKIRSRK